jgi:hypothetical protein
MGTIVGLVGVVLFLSGFFAITKVTDIGLRFVSVTQIHTLPLLNSIPSSLSESNDVGGMNRQS